MRVRPVSGADLETIRQLRNANREWFFDAREVTAAQQMAWFDSLAARLVDFYVIECDEVVVGTISLTKRDGEIEVGNLILDARARGRGLMRQALEALTQQPGNYFAEVKANNDRSLRVFRAAAFTERANGEVVRFTKRVGP
jgi:RimJ/RimL family protein N-acetyltransferase